MYLDPNTNIQGDLAVLDDPTTKVVTVDEIKSHLRIDTADEDTLLGLYIDSATEMAENYCGRHFIDHEYKLYYNEVIKKGSLIFPNSRLKLQHGGSDQHPIWYIDANGATQSSDAAYVDTYSNPSIFYLTSSFPNVTLKEDAANVFWVEFVTGFGAAATDVPQAIKQAIKLIVSDMYYQRR
jgi:uncharacterized phiE125 gp8 family phage protein